MAETRIPAQGLASSGSSASSSDQSSPAPSASGNLPGGTRVVARRISRSELGTPGEYADRPGEARPALQRPELYPEVRLAMKDLSEAVAVLSRMETPKLGSADPEALETARLHKGLLEERVRATLHVQKTRAELGLLPRFVPFPAAGRESERPFPEIRELAKSSAKDHYARATDVLAQRRFTGIANFLAVANFPLGSEFWHDYKFHLLANAWRDAQYHCYELTPAETKDSNSAHAGDEFDRQFIERWQAGAFDDSKGSIFIMLDGGGEFLLWHAGKGYNLSKQENLAGIPSKTYSDLNEHRPEVLKNLGLLFVAPPAVSNVVHALRKIPVEEAHRQLCDYAKKADISVKDMDFDELGRFMHERYANTIIARYSNSISDMKALGEALDVTEASFLLVGKPGRPLQEIVTNCFDSPGKQAGLANDDHTRETDRPEFEEMGYTSQQYLSYMRNKRAGREEIEPLAQDVPIVPLKGTPRIYNASNYSSTPDEGAKPSVKLQLMLGQCDEIGIISTGKLGTLSAPEATALENTALLDPMTWLASVLRFAGIEIGSPAELALLVHRAYAALPEIGVEFIRYCIQHLNDALPRDRKIKVTLEVIKKGKSLSEIAGDPTGKMMLYRRSGKLDFIIFHKDGEHAKFQSISGNTYFFRELDDVAEQERWWQEGPVHMLHFAGEGVLPLVDLTPTEDTAGESRKRRPPSVSSTSSAELALRPARKIERRDESPDLSPSKDASQESA
jgi:hypothetical protein